MLHVPLLESTGNLKVYADIITKAGFAIRGGHGEGSESMGGIYQISNQTTLGKSEAETISSLKHLANQVVDREITMREHVLKDFRHETEDAVFRAYGILTNCRKISLNEAMKLLSEIRLGKILGLLNCRINGGSIYNIMTHILPHNLQKVMGHAQDTRRLDILRAQYLRNAIM
jgi:protein arginine kinase